MLIKYGFQQKWCTIGDMLVLMIIFMNLLLVTFVLATSKDASFESDGELETLEANMRHNANMDLSADEEYEDLKAELHAYNTALASLAAGDPSRRK